VVSADTVSCGSLYTDLEGRWTLRDTTYVCCDLLSLCLSRPRSRQNSRAVPVASCPPPGGAGTVFSCSDCKTNLMLHWSNAAHKHLVLAGNPVDQMESRHVIRTSGTDVPARPHLQRSLVSQSVTRVVRKEFVEQNILVQGTPAATRHGGNRSVCQRRTATVTACDGLLLYFVALFCCCG
jgi:hypothetical protein